MKRKITFLLMSAMCTTFMFAGTISWGNYQWNAGTTVTKTFEAGSCVYAGGITDGASTDGSGITCWIGYSTADTDPSGTDWTWVQAAFNADWGNNWYYQTKLTGLPAGNYFFSWRYQYMSEPYFYVSAAGGNQSFTVNAWSSDITWSWADTGGAYNLTSINQGDAYPVGVQCFADGVTNSNAITPGSTITCEFGYSSVNTDPTASTGWTWTSVPYSSGTNNWNYYGSVNGIPAGNYTGAYRFSCNGQPFVYSSTTSFEVKNLTTVDDIRGRNISSLQVLNTLVNDGIVRLSFNNQESGTYSIFVFDCNGKLIQTTNHNSNSSIGHFELPLIKNITGIYYINIISPNKSKQSFKIIVN